MDTPHTAALQISGRVRRASGVCENQLLPGILFAVIYHCCVWASLMPSLMFSRGHKPSKPAKSFLNTSAGKKSWRQTSKNRNKNMNFWSFGKTSQIESYSLISPGALQQTESDFKHLPSASKGGEQQMPDPKIKPSHREWASMSMALTTRTVGSPWSLWRSD